MINGSDMMNVRKTFQSSTLQLIKDIQEIVERHNNSPIFIFIPKLIYYTTDWHTMSIYLRSRDYYATIDMRLTKLNGVEGFMMQIEVDNSK